MGLEILLYIVIMDKDRLWYIQYKLATRYRRKMFNEDWDAKPCRDGQRKVVWSM